MDEYLEPAMSHAKSDEIDRNLQRLSEIPPGLMRDHEGQYALMRHGDVVDFFPDAIDAQIAGNRRFDDNIFSIQCVQSAPEQLGYFSYAVDPRKT
ncbi:MAG: hypothetical protein EXR07_19230 [Acetobacteraceae bacterium]|nr:hypothetical protein [Acetobacteraceae bacterium]